VNKSSSFPPPGFSFTCLLAAAAARLILATEPTDSFSLLKMAELSAPFPLVGHLVGIETDPVVPEVNRGMYHWTRLAHDRGGSERWAILSVFATVNSLVKFKPPFVLTETHCLDRLWFVERMFKAAMDEAKSLMTSKSWHISEEKLMYLIRATAILPNTIPFLVSTLTSREAAAAHCCITTHLRVSNEARLAAMEAVLTWREFERLRYIYK
jgi:hypothetical protein